MKNTLNLFFFAIILLVAASCQSKLEKLENVVYSDEFTYDEKGLEKASELVDLYVEKAEADPEGKMAPQYMFKAAELAMNLNQTQKALDLYNKVIYSYPDYEKAPECLFLLAFIYENTLQNYGKAEDLYEMFLQKYPDHDFADDARFSLQYLGKSPEELMREFEQMNADTVNAVEL